MGRRRDIARRRLFDSPCDEVTVSNPHMWLGAAIAFALMGVAILVALRVRRA